MTITMEKPLTRKRTTWYPGKPGPKPTGLKRGILFPLQLDEDEYEYLMRISRHQMPSTGKKKKVAPYIRKKVLPPGWREALADLRVLQGANVKP